MKTKSLRTLACIGLSAFSLVGAACTPVVAQRGNLLEDYQIEEVKPHDHTQSDVLRLLGSPTAKAPFNGDIWYYIGQETEKRGILDPEVVKERIVIVRFDETGAVQDIEEVDRKRIEIGYNRDVTPTYGNEMTVIQQLLGNLGRFNPQSEGE